MIRASAVLLALLLCGCGSPRAADDSDSQPTPITSNPPPPATNPRPSTNPPVPPASNASLERQSIPWELVDCDFAYASLQAKAAEVTADLPEGFSLARATAELVPVGFEINICGSGTGLDGNVTPQTYASFWVAVTPPDGWGESGAGHFVNFDVLVQDEPRRRQLQDWGMPIHDGGITWAPLDGGAFRANYTLQDVGAFEIVAGPGVDLAPGGGAFDQWTAAGCGLAYWRTDYVIHAQQQSPGVVLVDASSRYSAWFDAPSVPAVVTHGKWDYLDGFVSKPQCTVP